MKTKWSLLTALSCLAALFAGCLVVSVYPYYTEQDLVFESNLLGKWIKTDDSAERWVFEKCGTNFYQLTVTDGQNTNTMQAHLFKLNGQKFLDLYAPDAKSDIQPPPIPSHLLLRVESLSPNVKLSSLDHGWLRDFLANNSKALRHQVIPTAGDKPEDRAIALTADTAELQAFIGNHLDTAAAWSQDFELKKD